MLEKSAELAQLNQTSSCPTSVAQQVSPMHRHTMALTAAAFATSFTVTQLRTNAVARWEYRPGSTLFVVWAHGRQDQDDQYDGRSWTRDYRELFGLHPTNTFLVKFAYWINR
jgi:hypothetical protein